MAASIITTGMIATINGNEAYNKYSKKYSKAVKVKMKYIPIYVKNDAYYVNTWIGNITTVKLGGGHTAKASWKFNSKYLKANNKKGNKKSFKALKQGETTITATDSSGKRTVEITFTIAKTAPERDQDPIYEQIAKDSSGYFNTYEDLEKLPIEAALDTTEAEKDNPELAKRYKMLADNIIEFTKSKRGKCETFAEKYNAIDERLSEKHFIYYHQNDYFKSSRSVLDDHAGTYYRLSRMTALFFRYMGIPAVCAISPNAQETHLFVKTGDGSDSGKWITVTVCFKDVPGLASPGSAEDIINNGFMDSGANNYYFNTSLTAA